jgi:hypothetical protein
MTYTIPDKPAEDKPRYVVVTDMAEIEAIQRCDLKSPIGMCKDGQWYAETRSLAQFRGQDVEIEV